MWLPHIHRIIEETNLELLNGDLPMAVFMVKLLSAEINLSGVENKQKYLDYIESDKPIKLRYFIQVTIKEEIEEECLLKEKEIEEEIKELDKMFSAELYENDATKRMKLQTPTYEDRMILYAKYIEGNDLKEYYAVYWTNKEVDFDKTGKEVDFDKTGRAASPPWFLDNYYNYFKTTIQNKDNVDSEIMDRKRRRGPPTNISIYRYDQERILHILNRFITKESFMKLIDSIHDVKVSKVMEDRDKNTLN